MKILVAEDDPVTRLALERMLQNEGHTVTTAVDGSEAWTLFEAGRFPVVISDWMMPGLDGPDLIRRIRERDAEQYSYVILLTSRNEKEDLVAAMEAGADDYLTKPFDREALRARLRAGRRIVELQHDLAERNAELARANQRMREDLLAAARIQQSLLPTDIPVFPGVEFAWQLQPCTELAGDILNVFPLGPGHAAFYLLDVSGHGVPAALMSVTLSRVLVPSPTQSTLLIRRVEGAGRRIVPPAEVAARLNHRFGRGASTGQFFTLLYGILDLQQNLVRYVSAGHPGALLLSRSDGPVLLEATGPPIGIRDGVAFSERVVTLRPRDRLYVYSDGLTEARSPAGEQFGSERLAAYVAQAGDTPLGQTLPGLIAAVQAWRGTPHLEDDASCLALETRVQP